ncbi:MAG: hypothetical protein JKY65_25860 [Planctomycetes bacterium]|nr:hypothetical protein [Planctomycetota bacterium]
MISPVRHLLLALSGLLLLSPACLGQALDAREQAWVASIAAVASANLADAEIEKETSDDGTDLYIGFDELRVVITRYTDAKEAFNAASQMAIYSSMGDDHTFIEVRGKDVLAMGGRLAKDDLVEGLRQATWGAYPWSGVKTKIRLLLLNLLDKGFVLRVNRPEGVAYTHLQSLLQEAKAEAAAAEADPDDADATYEVISAREVRMSQDGATAHMKVTDKYAIHVITREDPSKAVAAFAEVVQLPLRPKSVGASGALQRLGQ